MVSLSKLLAEIEVTAKIGNLDIQICGITDDSREVKDGYVFVCMPANYESEHARWSYRTDGHDYISDAISKGAIAIISQRPIPDIGTLPHQVTFIQVQDTRLALAKMAAVFYDNPSHKLLVVGVTGTNGKTSTCYLIRSIFSENGIKTAVSGTIIRRIAGKEVSAGMTTAEAHRLQKMLRDILDEGFQSVVMEVSSHALELKRADEIAFDVAVFTNLTQDHLDFHKDMAGYLSAKTKLFCGLGRFGKHSFAVINADDPAGENIIQHANAEIITYGVNSKADLKVTDFHSAVDGVSFCASIWGKDEIEVKLQLLGEYNLYNALAAMGVGVSQGIDLDVIKRGLESTNVVPGRFERVDFGQDYTVIVDYAHTPDALERVLSAARKLTKGRLITVFGCGGDRDKVKRPLMGRTATSLSDHSIITSDNPRTEDPMEIIRQIESGVESREYEVIPDRRSAIKRAIETAKEGDFIVIAGKGHENYQILKEGRIHFDDREVAGEFIQAH